MKDFIVVFGDNGARIVKGINVEDWKNIPGVLINPDLSKLAGVPPHRWRLDSSTIVETQDASKEVPPVAIHQISVGSAHYAVQVMIGLLSGMVGFFVMTLIQHLRH